MERTLVIIKPDAVNRNIVGEIIDRFEQKGLLIVGLKMAHLKDEQLEEHYAHHKDKPFFKELVEFMKHSPSILMVLEGVRAVDVVRLMTGVTYGVEAAPGTIRGDYSMSLSHTIIHASDSVEGAEEEVKRFFEDTEIFPYKRMDWAEVYNSEERGE